MRFIYTQPDGTAAICTAAPREVLERVLGPLTEESYKAHVMAKSLPPGVKEAIILADDWQPPKNREFRNAWVIADGRIVVDMPRARDIHRGMLRRERAPRLAELDIAAMRAIEAKDDKQIEAVAVAKQKLRDAPAHPAIERASTPNSLNAITLDVLTA